MSALQIPMSSIWGPGSKAQAMHMDLARAKEVFVVADGALWIWNLIEDRLKRRGQFWSPRGLADMLDIDVAVKNDTLEFLWN